MDLREYLFRERMSITEFAQKLEVSRAYMSRIVNGYSIPGKRLARDIEKASAGIVPNAWYISDPDGAGTR